MAEAARLAGFLRQQSVMACQCGTLLEYSWSICLRYRYNNHTCEKLNEYDRLVVGLLVDTECSSIVGGVLFEQRELLTGMYSNPRSCDQLWCKIKLSESRIPMALLVAHEEQ